jgi:WD40 repeat protein
MGHNKRLLLVAIPSLAYIVLNSMNVSAQQVIEFDASREVSDRSHTARVWDARTSGGVFTLNGHSNGVVSAAFYQKGERVLTGGGADCTAIGIKLSGSRVWQGR